MYISNKFKCFPVSVNESILFTNRMVNNNLIECLYIKYDFKNSLRFEKSYIFYISSSIKYVQELMQNSIRSSETILNKDFAYYIYCNKKYFIRKPYNHKRNEKVKYKCLEYFKRDFLNNILKFHCHIYIEENYPINTLRDLYFDVSSKKIYTSFNTDKKILAKRFDLKDIVKYPFSFRIGSDTIYVFYKNRSLINLECRGKGFINKTLPDEIGFTDYYSATYQNTYYVNR